MNPPFLLIQYLYGEDIWEIDEEAVVRNDLALSVQAAAAKFRSLCEDGEYFVPSCVGLPDLGHLYYHTLQDVSVAPPHLYTQHAPNISDVFRAMEQCNGNWYDVLRWSAINVTFDVLSGDGFRFMAAFVYRKVASAINLAANMTDFNNDNMVLQVLKAIATDTNISGTTAGGDDIVPLVRKYIEKET